MRTSTVARRRGAEAGSWMAKGAAVERFRLAVAVLGLAIGGESRQDVSRVRVVRARNSFADVQGVAVDRLGIPVTGLGLVDEGEIDQRDAVMDGPLPDIPRRSTGRGEIGARPRNDGRASSKGDRGC